jgi:cardiolipin synthase
MSEVARLLVSHLLSIVSFLMAMILLGRAAQQRRATGSTVAWLLAIVLIPYIGLPFYLIFGGRKVKAARAAKKVGPTADHSTGSRLERMLCASGAMAPTAGNRVVLLEDGEAAFATLVSTIESAERTVNLSTLVFAGDEVGEAVTLLLEKKARAGVQVRVLIDGLFKFRSKRKQIARLRAAGAKVAWFMRLWTLPTRGSVNLRLHRKEVIVDDRIAIVGGMNIAREYMGPTPLPSRWRDLSLTVTGPAVADIGRLFRDDWEFAAHERLDAGVRPASSPSAAEEKGEGKGAPIQVVGSGPDSENDLIYDAFLAAIFDAQRRIWIATPYFVPDEALVHALALAIRRGVEVRILVPLKSNHWTADLAGAAYLRELRDIGGVIHCYEPGMMHAKIVLVDEDLGILGSANMDRRSFFLDYELALLISAPAEVARMEAWLLPLFERSVELPPAGRIRALVEPLARLLAPLE